MMEARRVGDDVNAIARTHFAQQMSVRRLSDFELALLASDEKKPARLIESEASRTVASVFPSRDDRASAQIDRKRSVGPEVGICAATRAIDQE